MGCTSPRDELRIADIIAGECRIAGTVLGGGILIHSGRVHSDGFTRHNACTMQSHLDGRVLGNHASAAAGGVKEGTVHRVLSQHRRQGAAIVIADDCVCHAQALHVARDGAQAQRIHLIGKDGSCVSHQGCYVGRLTTCT